MRRLRARRGTLCGQTHLHGLRPSELDPLRVLPRGETRIEKISKVRGLREDATMRIRRFEVTPSISANRTRPMKVSTASLSFWQIQSKGCERDCSGRCRFEFGGRNR